VLDYYTRFLIAANVALKIIIQAFTQYTGKCPIMERLHFMTHDVFISYSTQDKNIADASCSTLENRKIRCWIAPRDILPSDDYASAIIKAIENSRIMLLVFSKSSNISPYVIREVQVAVSRGIPIIPFRIEDVKPTPSMEFWLGPKHWLDALTPPLEKHMQKLSNTIQILLANKEVVSSIEVFTKEETETTREVLAKAIHGKYLKNSMRFKPASDPSMQPWDSLGEVFKESSRRQVDTISEKLLRVNCGFAPVMDREPIIFKFTDQEIEVMAEMEHESWNSEKLLNGWVYGKKKDFENKVSPYLVPWSSLTNDIKEWDRQAMRELSEFLAEAKFEIHRLG
jgi:hypothetical protein